MIIDSLDPCQGLRFKVQLVDKSGILTEEAIYNKTIENDLSTELHLRASQVDLVERHFNSELLRYVRKRELFSLNVTILQIIIQPKLCFFKIQILDKKDKHSSVQK